MSREPRRVRRPWRDHLTEQEARDIARLEAALAARREELRALQRERTAIQQAATNRERYERRRREDGA